MGTRKPWRAAMDEALYGPSGFYRRTAPALHFRTSVHASPLFAGAVLELLDRVDAALGRPPVLDLVDVGAGRGELLTAVLASRPRPGVRLTGVEVAARPPALPGEIGWTAEIPRCSGLLIANEWLDNVPVDVAILDGSPRRMLVDAQGTEEPGPELGGPDREWLDRWWPLAEPGDRAELGLTRDEAWRAAVSRLDRGLAVAIDYGHRAGERPPAGTLTGYRDGRQVHPVPNGSCDLTAHVAVDSLGGELLTQRDALRALGVTGARPPRELASADPARYLRELAAASEAGELLDPDGLGGFWWAATGHGVRPGDVFRG
jgi:SAM-dependent MidA family methyltransferase